jgi:hypothetical protein
MKQEKGAKKIKLDNSNSEEHLDERDDEDEEEHVFFQVENSHANDDEEKVEILFLSNNSDENGDGRMEKTSLETTSVNKEEKFISFVYPDFKGKTKLNLIDQILDLKRQNELLKVKVQTYERTIKELL